MPESTIITPGRLAANRTAQEATDRFGSFSRKSCSTLSGTWARVPPFTGSMTMMGTLCFLATSYTPWE